MSLFLFLSCFSLIIVASNSYLIQRPHRQAFWCPHTSLKSNKFGWNDLGATESSFHLQAVETFDGSSIIDPIVVSSVFWSSLKAKLLSIVIGQIIATFAFAVITYIFSVQIKNLGESISKLVIETDETKERIKKVTGVLLPSRKSSFVQPDYRKLVLCLIIDTIGTSSELIPLIGELTDLVYAPIAAIALRSLYNNSNIVFVIEFIEEFFPFTDILPFATICWVIETFYQDSYIAQTLRIGAYSSSYDSKESSSFKID